MRIKSQFKDYYDCMLAYDKEPEPLFVRKTETVHTDKSILHYRNIRWQKVRDRYNSRQTNLITFCGKVHTFVQIHTKNGRYAEHEILDSFPGETKKHTFYTFESMLRFVRSHKLSFKSRNHKTESEFVLKLEYSMFDWEHVPENKLKDILYNPEHKPIDELCNGIITENFDRFGDQLTREPILVLEGNSLEICPRLANYEFAKVVPPQTAYQELNRWFSNKTVPLKPIPSIDDKTMAEIKGFDKWSFRKTPSK